MGSVQPGEPWRDAPGLWVFPLAGAGGTEPSPPALGDSEEVELTERTTPEADAIEARNRGTGTVVARIGEVIRGGLADRAVVASVRIDPGARVELSVVPIQARWWPAGALAAGGVLPATLLVQAALSTLGEDVVSRAAALTSLWAMPPAEPTLDEMRHLRGFALLRGDRPLAFHLSSLDLAVSIRADPGGPDPELPGLTAAAGEAAQRLISERLVERVVRSSPPLIELWALDAAGLLDLPPAEPRARRRGGRW